MSFVETLSLEELKSRLAIQTQNLNNLLGTSQKALGLASGAYANWRDSIDSLQAVVKGYQNRINNFRPLIAEPTPIITNPITENKPNIEQNTLNQLGESTQQTNPLILIGGLVAAALILS